MFESINTCLKLVNIMIEQRPVIWNKTVDVYKYRNLTRDARMEFC